jgi:hypothetical protein
MILDCARARTGAHGALRLWICGFAAALAAALTGCSTNTNISNGTPVVTVHADAAGDFSSYLIGITLYSLTRSDGYVAYPAGYTAEEFVDLTQRVDLTELLNAVGVPAGSYKSVVLGLDYSVATVYVKGQSTVATVLNTSKANPGIVDLTVTLDPAHPLVVGLNKSTPLALDVDLAASNTVSGNSVTVRPFAAATATPADTEPVRARGLFVVANPSAGNFIENIRPFEDNIYSTVGALTVNTTSSTYFNVNGSVYTGTAGLTAVAALAASTPMVAYGTLGDMSTITPAFTATQVYAGTVVSNGALEHALGIVSAISGDKLTLLGATYLPYAGYCPSNLCFAYFPTATVTIGPSTLVTKDGTSGTTFSIGSISVGSQIDAVGIGPTSASNGFAFDATSGVVRLQSTPAWGTLNSATAGTATLSLLSLGAFPAADFNFAGTGTSSSGNATATSYQINTGAADESATPAGTLLRADGFPTAFGSAPPDFDASTVTPGSSGPADLVVEWIAGSAGSIAPFTAYDSASLTLNLNSVNTHEVVVGPQTLTLTGTPSIDISAAGQFAIGNAAKGVAVFSAPSAFASDLTSTLNGSTQVYRVVAIGTYDAATNTFAASRVDVALE